MYSRLISILFVVVCFFLSCSKQPDPDDYSQMYPPYRLIKIFSEKLESEDDLILTSYGINENLPKGYEYKNGIGNFVATYSLFKNKDDKISVEQARNLLTFVAENFLKEIKSIWVKALLMCIFQKGK